MQYPFFLLATIAVSMNNEKKLTTYKRLLQVSRQYLFLFFLGVLGTVILSGLDAGLSWLIKPIVDQGFIARNRSFIYFLPVLVVVIFALRGAAGFASDYYINRVSRNVVMDFRRMLFDKLLHLPASFFDVNSSGHLLSMIIYNVEQVAQASSEALVILLREGTLMIGLLCVMFIVSWKLSLLFLLIAPLLSWVMKWSSKRLRRLSAIVQDSVGEVTHVADEGIQNYKVVRIYGGEQYEYNKFLDATKKNQQRELKVVVTNSVGTALVQLLLAIPLAVTLYFATMPSMHVSAGAFAAVVVAMVQLLRPVRRITTVNSQIQKGVAGAASLFELLDKEIEQDHGTVPLVRAKGHIEYQNILFSYENSKSPILQAINFTIEPGQTVAIVGRSGGGKTTLVNLLPRFYELTEGAVRIDGVNVNDYCLKDLRRQFSIVSQNTTLFNDTVAKNIAYGCSEEIDEARIIEAAESAHAMDFIQTLPQGLHTVIGEDGVLLSGGQRQRIAIARALLRDAPILILDEATSALDTHAERHIQAALEALMQQRTTLVIAHRLSTIEKADRILVIDAGYLVEEGTHESLIKLGGAYAQLHQMQFKDPHSA